MYKIMLADDEGIVIDALRFIIEKEFGDECVIESAKTGRSIIELAERFRPDIAFMDIQMPGINGIDAMKEIRTFSRKMVFIVVSAYDKFDYAKEAINLGVMEYLTKPINKERVIQALRRAMKKIDEDREKRSNDLMIKEKLETVIPMLENGLVYSILFQEEPEEIENYCTLLEIEQKYGYMMVIACGEEQNGKQMTNAVGASVKAQNYYPTIRGIASEFFQGVMGSVMANKIAFFIPYEEEKMEYNERIERIEKTREMVRKLRKQIDIRFRVGIGSIKPLQEQYASYSEANKALSNATTSVAHVEDVVPSSTFSDDYPIEIERQVFDYVECGNMNEMLDMAKRFFDWMEKHHSDNLMDIRLKDVELVMRAETMAFYHGGMTYSFMSRSDYLPSLLAMEDTKQIRKWFLEKLSAATQSVATRVEEKSESIVQKAKAYINAHYDKEISLDEMSREYEISPYYFSKLFKDEVGQNFIEYLTQIRMEKAKELLSSSEYTMKEICIMVGYADPNYFSRTFKKNVGVTPTEYKEGVR